MWWRDSSRRNSLWNWRSRGPFCSTSSFIFSVFAVTLPKIEASATNVANYFWVVQTYLIKTKCRNIILVKYAIWLHYLFFVHLFSFLVKVYFIFLMKCVIIIFDRLMKFINDINRRKFCSLLCFSYLNG